LVSVKTSFFNLLQLVLTRLCHQQCFMGVGGCFHRNLSHLLVAVTETHNII